MLTTRVLEDFPAVQPHAGEILGQHYLPSTPSTVRWGRLPSEADAACLTVESGATVTIDTISHEGLLDDQGRDPVAYFGRRGVPPDAVLHDAIEVASGAVPRSAGDGPHVVTGPVAVTGARPGDVLALRVLDLAPRVGYGIVSNRHGRGALPGEMPAGPGTRSVFCTLERTSEGTGARMRTADDGLSGPSIRFPARFFLGLVGVATPGVRRRGSVAPGDFGGNLDIALMGVGSTLHLPVLVDGGMFYVSDPHYAQGDGEVALTAFEAPLRATVHVEVLTGDQVLRHPDGRPLLFGETDDLLVPVGLDRDLDEAMRRCVRNAITLLGARYGLDPTIAYAYLSAAGDFSVSQVVDDVKGVHAALRKRDFLELVTRA